MTIEAIENLVTQIVDNEGCSYGRAVELLREGIVALYPPEGPYMRKPVTKGVNREMPDATLWAAMPEYGVYVRFDWQESDPILLSMPMLADNEPDARYYPGDVVQVPAECSADRAKALIDGGFAELV